MFPLTDTPDNLTNKLKRTTGRVLFTLPFGLGKLQFSNLRETLCNCSPLPAYIYSVSYVYK